MTTKKDKMKTNNKNLWYGILAGLGMVILIGLTIWAIEHFTK